jgi:hypothetical protein
MIARIFSTGTKWRGSLFARALLAIAMLWPLAACALHPPLDQDCAGDAQCAARAGEPALIAASHGLAERDGDTLVLHPTGTPALRFTDHKAACSQADANNCDGYALMGSFARGHALVVRQFLYRGGYFLLIDNVTGRRTRLEAMPVFSPDGAEFLVAPYDEKNDTGPNNLEIWRRVADDAVMEWAHTIAQEHDEDPALPFPYQTRLVRWNQDRLTLEFFTRDAQPWRGSLARAADGWHLAAQSPPDLFSKR